MIRLSLAQARELAESILLHNGFNPAHARAVSDTVLAGERDGCASHGLYRLSGCVNSLRAGKAIPEGWGGDAQGRSSTDANVVLDSGAMLTFGGHKGSALAAMVELIAGPLIGDLTSADSLSWDAGSKSSLYHGELIIALDPQRFLGLLPSNTWPGPKCCLRVSKGRVRVCRRNVVMKRGREAWWKGYRYRKPCTATCWRLNPDPSPQIPVGARSL